MKFLQTVMLIYIQDHGSPLKTQRAADFWYYCLKK